MPQRSGFWIRTLASLVDVLAVIPLYLLSVWIAWRITFDPERMERIASGVFWSSWLLYSTLEIWTAGTLGKRVLGRRIAQMNGEPADRWRLFLRWSGKQFPFLFLALFEFTDQSLFRAVSGFGSLVVFVGCLYASNDDHLTWHDQWAGTAVIRRTRTPRPALPIVQMEQTGEATRL